MTGTGPRRSGTVALPLQWPLVGRHTELEGFAASLADSRAHGFVVHGPAGVGKTRLADQCLAVADVQGRMIARATATEGLGQIPLGALAHLLPAGIGAERSDLVAVVAQVRPILVAQAVNGPLVLFVDDLHLLDPTSATLLGQLVDADLVFLVGTVRSDATLPGGLESLWRRARVQRIDLANLDRAALDALLHLVLRGPVEATTAAAIWHASDGNVLFARELVLASVGSGILAEQHGVWRLTGPLVGSTRLHELIASRLAGLGTGARAAMDVIAVWGTIGLPSLEAIVDGASLDELDRRGLLRVRSDRRRQEVSLAQPLYGDLVRSRMPELTRRRLLLDMVARIDGHGARRRKDPIVVATATLEATGSADRQLLLRAARLARLGHDFVQVERLARAALAEGGGSEAGMLLGEALHEVGTHAECETVLVAAEHAGGPDDLLAQIVELRARNLMWGLRRYEDALAVNRAMAERLTDPAAVDELRINEAMLLTYSGRPLLALETLDRLGPPATPRARALHALAELPALVATGLGATGAARAGRAFAEHSALPGHIAITAPGVHLITRAYGLTECGQLAESIALSTAVYESIVPTDPPAGAMWFGHQLGRGALLAGRPLTAIRWLSEAWARCEESEIDGPRRLVLSLLANAHALLGDVVASAAVNEALDQVPEFPFTRPEQDLGRAWARAADGDLPGARLVLRTAASLAAETGYRGSEAWLLHDIARLGDPASVVDRLEQLATECEGPLVAAYAAHARAAAAGHAGGLAAAADSLEAIGCMLIAGEAANEAAQAYQNAGDGRSAAALRTRALALAERCEGARTPALAPRVMVAPLTRRERDIAELAAAGEPSKVIADRLYLSVRTVNNHLQNVYSKLGVSSRRQLVDALADAARSQVGDG